MRPQKPHSAGGSLPAQDEAALHPAEAQFHQIVEKIEDRILHHCDRPEIEMNILGFLQHALGATTEGIARHMGIGLEAAAIHLQALDEAKRIWGQPGPAGETVWHISLEGTHYLTEKTDRLS